MTLYYESTPPDKTPYSFGHGALKATELMTEDLREMYNTCSDIRAASEDTRRWPKLDHMRDMQDSLRSGLITCMRYSQSSPPDNDPTHGRVVGACTLAWNSLKDQEIWSGTGADLTEGIIVHRLVSRVSGRRIGERVLRYVGLFMERHNQAVIRLDCDQQAHRLRQYYEDLGFEHIGNAERPGNGYKAALYAIEPSVLIERTADIAPDPDYTYQTLTITRSKLIAPERISL